MPEIDRPKPGASDERPRLRVKPVALVLWLLCLLATLTQPFTDIYLAALFICLAVSAVLALAYWLVCSITERR